VFERTNPNGPVPRRLGRDALAPLGLATLALAALALAWVDPMALCALPALVLPVMFALRRYPGERLLAVLSEPRRGRWERPRSSVPRPARPQVGVPRGGLLLARALAVRPPPAVSLAAS
jgi:hypothetical protein